MAKLPKRPPRPKGTVIGDPNVTGGGGIKPPEGSRFVGKSRRGRPKASAADKAAAKYHGLTLKAWREAGKPSIPKKKSSDTPRGSDAPPLTRAQKAELKRLMAAQAREMKVENRKVPDARRTTTTIGNPLVETGREVEGGVNTFLLSKELPPTNISPEALKRGIETGMLYIDPKSGAVKSTGKYASGADVTGRMMRGTDEVAPTESEIMKMGGFEIRKAGGSVKKKKKKKKKTRAVGVGKALRGYGAVRKG